MPINIYHSRRGRFNRCRYWLPTPNAKDILEHQLAPDGIFYAKEENAFSDTNEQAGGMFMYNRKEILISTTDIVDDLTVNSIVEFKGNEWIVNNIQTAIAIKETEYSQNKVAKTLLTLRR